jgi:hypothetical protein
VIYAGFCRASMQEPCRSPAGALQEPGEVYDLCRSLCRRSLQETPAGMSPAGALMSPAISAGFCRSLYSQRRMACRIAVSPA